MKHRKKTRILWLLPVLALLGAALALGISAWVVGTTEDRILTGEEPPPEGVDAILILGCGVRPDGSPSPMLTSRMERGADLYRAGWADCVLLSGDDSGPDYNELAAMERAALALGIPGEAVLEDHAGFSTYDSLWRAREVWGLDRVILVTQEYHLYRALYLAEALGLEAWGVAAAPRNDAGQRMRDLREILARDKDFFNAILQPEPRVTGPAGPEEGAAD